MNFSHLFSKALLTAAFASLVLSSCKKDDVAPVTTYTTDPVGSQTILKTGSITNVDGPGTTGTLAIISDANGSQFVKLNSDFVSGFATGTVVVYLAKTSEKIGVQRGGGTTASNVQAIGFVSSNGQHFLKIPSSITGFSYVVLYCETAEINFGTALLQ